MISNLISRHKQISWILWFSPSECELERHQVWFEHWGARGEPGWSSWRAGGAVHRFPGGWGFSSSVIYIYSIYLTRDASKAGCNALWKRHPANSNLTPNVLIEEAKCTVHMTCNLLMYTYLSISTVLGVHMQNYSEINEKLIIISSICKFYLIIIKNVWFPVRF